MTNLLKEQPFMVLELGMCAIIYLLSRSLFEFLALFVLLQAGPPAFRLIYQYGSTRGAIGWTKHKVSKIKNLTSLVGTQYSNKLTIIWICIQILAKTMYIALIQYINNTVTRVDKSTFVVSYVVGNKLYKMRVRLKKGPKKLINAFDENGTDVTKELQMYLGPNENFHGDMFTPMTFDKREITMNLSSGDEIVFKESELIHLGD